MKNLFHDSYFAPMIDPEVLDWYEITADEMTNLTFCCAADFPLLIVLVDGNQGCGNPPIMDMTSGPPGEEICLVAGLEPGIYWLWVGPSVFEGVPCGSFYEMNVCGLSSSTRWAGSGTTLIMTLSRLGGPM